MPKAPTAPSRRDTRSTSTPTGDDQAAFDELERAGIWTRSDDGYLLAGWSRELRQSTAAEVERCRESSRRRRLAHRTVGAV